MPARRCTPYRFKNRFLNHPGERKVGRPLTFFQIFSDAICNRIRFIGANYEHWQMQHEVVPVERSIEPRITWIGHSSFLIQIGNINILADPIFGNVSPLYPRLLKPGLNYNQLPPIDVVLISHNHRDHMDATSLLALKEHKGITFLVPWGDKAWFDKRGFERAHEYMWWEQYRANHHKIACTFLPASHWSQRTLFDHNRSLWGSWMIEFQGYKIYFAGDTAYGNHFGQIGSEFANIDVALMPIGPCEPDEHMRRSHVSAQEAGKGFLDLGARNFVPMHWGTFFLGSTDPFESPINRLKHWWHGQGTRLDQCQLHILKCGQHKQFEMVSAAIPLEKQVEHKVHL